MQPVREFFDYLETKKYKLHVRVFLSRYRGYTVCPDCHGSRLRQEARDIYIDGKNIADVCRMTIQDSHEFFANLKLTKTPGARSQNGSCGKFSRGCGS